MNSRKCGPVRLQYIDLAREARRTHPNIEVLYTTADLVTDGTRAAAQSLAKIVVNECQVRLLAIVQQSEPSVVVRGGKCFVAGVFQDALREHQRGTK